MKKLIILFLPLIFLFNIVSAQHTDNYFTQDYHVFEVGRTYPLFGNKVKLRDAPNLKSELIELIEIDKTVKILEKMSEADMFKEVLHPWYKVEVGDKTGYILGALIANYKITSTSKKVDFYFHILPEYKDNPRSLSIKTYQGKELLDQVLTNLIGWQFSFKVSGNRGFYEISDIVMVDYHSEACGMEGGMTYLFWDGEKLNHAADLSEIGDGGMLHVQEEFIFPDDPESLHDGKAVIIYKGESGEEIDEDTHWYVTKSQTRKLNWDKKKRQLVPKNFQDEPK